MNSENSETSDQDRLLLNLPNEISLKKAMHMLHFQILPYTLYGKI